MSQFLNEMWKQSCERWTLQLCGAAPPVKAMRRKAWRLHSSSSPGFMELAKSGASALGLGFLWSNVRWLALPLQGGRTALRNGWRQPFFGGSLLCFTKAFYKMLFPVPCNWNILLFLQCVEVLFKLLFMSGIFFHCSALFLLMLLVW